MEDLPLVDFLWNWALRLVDNLPKYWDVTQALVPVVFAAFVLGYIGSSLICCVVACLGHCPCRCFCCRDTSQDNYVPETEDEAADINAITEEEMHSDESESIAVDESDGAFERKLKRRRDSDAFAFLRSQNSRRMSMPVALEVFASKRTQDTATDKQHACHVPHTFTITELKAASAEDSSLKCKSDRQLQDEGDTDSKQLESDNESQAQSEELSELSGCDDSTTDVRSFAARIDLSDSTETESYHSEDLGHGRHGTRKSIDLSSLAKKSVRRTTRGRRKSEVLILPPAFAGAVHSESGEDSKESDLSTLKPASLSAASRYPHKAEIFEGGTRPKHRRRFSIRSLPALSVSKLFGEASKCEHSLVLDSELFDAIRRGALTETTIAHCAEAELCSMFAILCSVIYALPFAVSQSARLKMIKALRQKVQTHESVKQKALYFLSAHCDSPVFDLFQDLVPPKCLRHLIADVGTVEDSDSDLDDDSMSLSLSSVGEDSGFYENPLRCWRLITSSGALKAGDKIDFGALLDGGDASDSSSFSERLLPLEPLSCCERVSSVLVRRVFESSARPVWVETLNGDGQVISEVILKEGDDLRQDSAVMHMFRLFNSLWADCGLAFGGRNAVRALTYHCEAMTADLGCIELIDDCLPLRDVGCLSLSAEDVGNLVATAAGAYVAAHVLGVRDRHFDNVLIRSDGTLFHIDFGFAFGHSPGLDASIWAITSDLQAQLGEHWSAFVDTCVDAFMALRKHRALIASFAQMRFALISEDIATEARQFVRAVLAGGSESDDAVRQSLREELHSAPHNWNTKFKNTVHSLATSYPIQVYADYFAIATWSFSSSPTSSDSSPKQKFTI